MISFFTAIFVCILIASITALIFTIFKVKVNANLKETKLYTVGFCLLFFIVYSFLSCWKFDNLWFGLWDLGIFDSMIYKMSRFDGFMRDFRGGFDHFCPAAVLWVPLYWIFNSPKVLLISQSFLLAVAAIPLFYCTKNKLRSPLMSMAVVAMYLLNPLLSRFALFEFHIECLFPLVLFSAWYFYEKKKYNYFIAILLLGILVKEDFCIIIIAVGIYLLSLKKYKLGLLCFAATAISILFILYIYFPYIINYNYYHQGRYPPLFDANILVFIKNSYNFILNGINLNTLAVTLGIITAFAFLPLFAPREFLLIGGPVLFIHFCSVFDHQKLLMSHYSIEAIAVFPLIAMYGIYNLRKEMISHRLVLKYIYSFCFTIPLIGHIMFCELPNHRYFSFIPKYQIKKQGGILSIPFRSSVFKEESGLEFNEIIRAIPQDFTVTVQNNLGCQFLRHKSVHSLPGPDNSDAYLFHYKCFHGFDSTKTLNNKIKFLSKNKSYQLILERKGLMIFIKKNRLKDLKALF